MHKVKPLSESGDKEYYNFVYSPSGIIPGEYFLSSGEKGTMKTITDFESKMIARFLSDPLARKVYSEMQAEQAKKTLELGCYLLACEISNTPSVDMQTFDKLEGVDREIIIQWSIETLGKYELPPSPTVL